MTSRTLAIAGVALLATLAVAQDNVFTKDPRLHQSMWGIAYTPPNAANYPTCGDKIEDIVKDVQLMSQLATRLRLYGADCGQTDLVLNAVKRTQVNMQVFLGIFLDGTAETYNRQLNETITALQTYGTDNVAGVTVGNEYILTTVTGNQDKTTSTNYVIAQVNDARKQIAALNLPRSPPIGTADAGSMVTLELAQAADYVMANTHPFFSGVTINGAADWTAQYLVNDEPRFVVQANKTLYNAEIGWPTAADAGGSLDANGSIASIPNTQTLLDTFVCAANTNNTNGYFWFEFADGAWKKPLGGAEPYWGLFDTSRNLKNLTIPTCLAEAATTPGYTGGDQGGGSSPSGGASSGGSAPTGTNSAGKPTGTAKPSWGVERWSAPGGVSVAAGLIVMFVGAVGLL